MPMTREQVEQKVKEILIEALQVDEEEVTPEAKLFSDLGAESIDILDIQFKLEKAFGIKIPRAELFPEAIVNNPDYVESGKLNAAGLAALKKAMPHVEDFSEFEANPEVSRLNSLFTVKVIVNYVMTKVGS
jgi:acyl carrier protein